MATYFGYTTIYDTPQSGVGGYLIWNGADIFTCPGDVGVNQTIKEISGYTKSAGGTPGHIRLAVYDILGTTLIAQGAAEITIDSITAGWYGHLTQGDITPNPAILVGGTTYKIVLANDSNDVTWYYNGADSNSTLYYVADYTGGFPSSLPTGLATVYARNLRCGVDPAAAAGLSIPVAMYNRMQQ